MKALFLNIILGGLGSILVVLSHYISNHVFSAIADVVGVMILIISFNWFVETVSKISKK